MGWGNSRSVPAPPGQDGPDAPPMTLSSGRSDLAGGIPGRDVHKIPSATNAKIAARNIRADKKDAACAGCGCEHKSDSGYRPGLGLRRQVRGRMRGLLDGRWSCRIDFGLPGAATIGLARQGRPVPITFGRGIINGRTDEVAGRLSAASFFMPFGFRLRFLLVDPTAP